MRFIWLAPTLFYTVICFLLCAEISDSRGDSNVRKRSADQCTCDPSLPCDAKYQRIPGHTACLTKASNAVPRALGDADKDAIVDHHNRLRGQVDPVATNMQEIFWDDEVAMLAQKWAEACDVSTGGLHHDKVRDIPGRYSVGQNIGTGYSSFSDAIEAWFAEKDNYRPLFGTSVRQVAGPKPIGHYTQMVWATTNRIGCGFAECGGTAFHVCNYAPMGNFVPFDSPYETGPTKCSACKKCEAGLCDCGDLTCENFGKLNVTTCSCGCKYQEYHKSPTCQLSCNYDKDLYFCGTQKSFYKQDCGISYTSSACPKLCDVCPCSDNTLTPSCSGSSSGKDSDSGSPSTWKAPIYLLVPSSLLVLLVYFSF